MIRIWWVLLLLVALVPAARAAGENDWVTYSLDFQGWDVQNIGGENYTLVRRAENSLTFRFLPGWSAVVMLDPAKTIHAGKDDSYLQDAFFQWQMNRNWLVQAGQFKIPFGEEGTHSSKHLDTIERAQFDLGSNKFSDLRELGVMGQYQDDHFLAQLGAFSGDPTNQSVGGGIHEGAVRLIYSPDSHFHFGASVSRGTRHNVDKPYDYRESNDKNGLEFTWSSGPLLFESEYVNGLVDVPVVGVSGAVTGTRPITREGWYAKVHYDISPRVQAVLRDDAFFPNVNAPSDGERDITAGVNFWFEKTPEEVEFQVNYVNRRSFGRIPVPDLWLGAFKIDF